VASQRFKRAALLAWNRLVHGGIRYSDLDPKEALLMAFTMLLHRDPDPQGRADFLRRMESGTPATSIVEPIISSAEFLLDVPFSDLFASMHISRCQFVRSLPKGKLILDLGGSNQGDERGAMVSMGYPYAFDRLVVVDLPSSERHEQFRSGEWKEVETSLGTVEYHYHSMVDLSSFPDRSFDLVYSGQSFEHIWPNEGATLLKEVHRVLKDEGSFALDTPNGPVWRHRFPDELINPDHKVEYSHGEMVGLLAHAGFNVDAAWGLNYLGRSLAGGRFDDAEAAQHHGLFSQIEECLLLAYVCSKSPEAASGWHAAS
jgi:predicted SAM-dependent methyltransferase